MKAKLLNTLVSVIIPTYNEEKDIAKCLESLLSQTYVPLEILVVDDGSTDQTRAVVKKHLTVVLYNQSHKGPGAARNLGATQAKGEVLVFVDADMFFDRDFILNLTKPIIEGEVVGTFSKEEYLGNGDNPWARAFSLVRGFTDGRMHPRDYPDEQPVFRAILKSEFNKVGGFDTKRGYDDDWSLSENLGVFAQHSPNAKFYHNNPTSISLIWTQVVWMGQRKYKYGILGKLANVIKHNLLFSVIKGCLLFYKYTFLHVIWTQIIVDLGLSIGILKSIFSKAPKK